MLPKNLFPRPSPLLAPFTNFDVHNLDGCGIKVEVEPAPQACSNEGPNRDDAEVGLNRTKREVCTLALSRWKEE